ncbi:MAG: uL15 family ribosomal protein [Clostridia bacterium]|nr:uL15 family ribosomal protein [Clostridia bacterium]
MAQALRQLSDVKCDYLTTLPSDAIVLQSGATYPSDYDHTGGYWGVLHSPSSLPSDAELSILPTNIENIRAIEKAIRKAAKRGELKTLGGTPNEATVKELKHAKVALALDISLSCATPLASTAELKLLLDEEFGREKILGIVFVDSDNNVEFYSTEQDNSLISFNPSHFSKYYIVVENIINLMPLIIFLTTLITLEFILLIFILILRFNRKRKENDEMLPMLRSCFLPLTSFSLTQIKPSGALTTTVLLSVAALALGCAVAMLARLELREYRASKRKVTPRSASHTQPLLSASTRKALPEKRAALKAAEDLGGEPYYTDTAIAVEEREPIRDEDLEQLFDAGSEDAYTCFGKARHKAEINLDVIEDKFDDGDLVTLDALKRKKLVPKRTDYVKILARGALTKPLIVEANDFSRAAEEMLTALGGEAIRVRH